MKIKSLKVKLILSYSIIAVLSFGILGSLLYKNTKENSLRELKLSLINQARLVEAQLKPAIVGQMDPLILEKLAQDLSSRINLRLTVIEDNGNVLFDSEKSLLETEEMDNHANRPEVSLALEGAVGEETRFSDTLRIDMLYVALPVKVGDNTVAVVRLAMPLTSIETMLYAIRRDIVLTIVLVLVLTFVLGIVFTSSIVKPLNKIINISKKFSAGDFSHRVYYEANDEIGELARTLNKMAKDIEDKIASVSSQSQQLTAIFNSMIEGVIVTDKSGVIVSINQAVEDIFKVSRQEVEGKLFLEAVRNNEIYEVIQNILGKGRFFSKEITLHLPVQRVFEVNATPIFKDASVSGALVVIHDITEMRRLETVRRDFVANVSHELKTPLTSIKGFIETLLEGALEDKENNRNFLEIIQSHAIRLDALVNDLLSLSHLESREIRVEKTAFDLNAQVEEVLRGFKSQLRAKGIEVENVILKNLMVSADKDRIHQVLVNLIDNAIKFNKEKGFIKIQSESVSGNIKVIVEDSGMGIPTKDLPRIFERFYRVDKARSRELGGTGLGLSIVKHIIELHKGAVGVESAEGLGCKFWFTLPK
ncbi:MAG: ATP-binding protein [Candidatus Omnitrophota bacterium]|jgi:two-component system phosphate regulon sensor histidine kinase PhoR